MSNVAQPRELSDFNYPSAEIQQCPYPFYEALRSAAPVYRIPDSNVYMISRYSDVLTAIRDFDTFSSSRAWADSDDPDVHAILARGWPQRDVLLGEDPPLQTKHRKLVGYAFTPKRIAAMREPIYRYANDLIDGLYPSGAADIVEEFAQLLPIRIIADILGVPYEDHPQFTHWSRDYLDWTARSANPIGRERELACAESIVAFQQYVFAKVLERRAAPRDDFLTDLLRASEADASIDEGTLIDIMRTVLVAGHETTMKLLGSVMHLLLANPAELDRVRADPTLAPKAVEEALRMEPPAQRLTRVATRDVEVAGVLIPAGSRVLLMIGAVNHDELFACPAEFHVDRDDVSRHLAFGNGIHFCLGAPLARMEGTATVELLLARLPNLRLAAANDFRYRLNPILRGLDHLFVEWELA